MDDCESCSWYKEHFKEEDLYTFYNLFKNKICVINRYGATPIKKTGLDHLDKAMEERWIIAPKDKN